MQMDRQKMKVKICLVGEGAVGKTCLIRRFIQDQFDDRYISTLGAKVSGNVPIEFLANKADLKDEMDVTEADIRRTAEAHRAPYLFTSAKTGQNVEDAFAKLAKMIASHSS